MFRTERFQVDKDVFVFGNRCGLARDDLFDFDMCRTLADKAQLLGRRFGYVDDAVAVEGAAVVDADDDAFAVFCIGYAHIAGNGQCFVGGGEGVHVVAVPAGGFAPVKSAAVPRGVAGLRELGDLVYRRVAFSGDFVAAVGGGVQFFCLDHCVGGCRLKGMYAECGGEEEKGFSG